MHCRHRYCDRCGAFVKAGLRNIAIDFICCPTYSQGGSKIKVFDNRLSHFS